MGAGERRGRVSVVCSKVEGVSGVTTWAQQVLVSRSVTTKIVLRAFEGFSGVGWGLGRAGT